jgi:hypothetical protein
MSDAYAHTNPQVRARVAALLRGWDRQLLHAVASRHWPGAEPVLPRLSHSANHGLLWFGAAAGMVVPASRRNLSGPASTSSWGS